MVSETIKQVLSAESESEKLLSYTKEQCRRIIKDAEEYSRNIYDQKVTQAEKEGLKLKSENQKRIEKYILETSEKCSHDKSEIRKKADENINTAVETISKCMFG